jgi:hypothetical protein
MADRARRVLPSAGPSVASKIFSWLSTSRLFLDHSQNELSDRFGQESHQYNQFIEATHWSFDNSVGYRFLSQFRNFFQHAGLPPISFQGTRGNTDDSDDYRLELVLDRDALLRDFEWKARVREDITQWEDQFRLLPLVSGAMVQFEFLANQLRESLRSATVGRLPELIEELQNVQADGLPVSLVRTTRIGPDRLTMQQKPLDIGSVNRCQQMSAIPGIPGSWDTRCLAWPDHACSSSGEALVGSALLLVPHRDGVGFVPTCDSNITDLSRMLVRDLGAAQLVHPSMLEYLQAGLAAHEARVTLVTKPGCTGE